MYLLVFATLVISMMSVYTQVLAVEAARLAANQMGIAQTMTSWHNAAVSMAASIIDTNRPQYNNTSASGCGLNWNVTGIGRCPSPKFGGSPININGGKFCQTSNGTVVDSANNNYLPCGIFSANDQQVENVHLSPGYSAATYEFSSAVYKDSGTGNDYVITFVSPATISGSNPSGFLTLPNGTQLGVTSGDLMNQLKRAGVPGYMLGTVAGGNLVTQGQSANGSPYGNTYPLPANLALDGSIAIVSSPDGL